MANTVRGSLKRNSIPISGSPTRRKRGRIARACLRCRIGKAKCVYSEGNSKCNKCLARDSECTSLLPGQSFEEAVEDYNLRRKGSKDTSDSTCQGTFTSSSYTSVSSEESTISPPLLCAEASAAAAPQVASAKEAYKIKPNPDFSPVEKRHSYTFGGSTGSLVPVGKAGSTCLAHTHSEPIRIPNRNIHRTPPRQPNEQCEVISFKEDIWSPHPALIATPQTMGPTDPHHLDPNMHIGLDSRNGSPLQHLDLTSQPVILQQMDVRLSPHKLDIHPLMVQHQQHHRDQMATPFRIKTQPIDPRHLVTPQMITPQMETPQMETPQMETPQMETPQMETPQMDTPMESHHGMHHLISPQMDTLKMEIPQMGIPQMETPQTEPHLIYTPRMEPHHMDIPQMETRGTNSHHVHIQSVNTEDMESHQMDSHRTEPHRMTYVNPTQVYPRMGINLDHDAYYPGLAENNERAFDYSFAYHKSDESDSSTKMNMLLRQLEMDLQMGPPVRSESFSEAVTSDFFPNSSFKTHLYSSSYGNEGYTDLSNEIFDEAQNHADYRSIH